MIKQLEIEMAVVNYKYFKMLYYVQYRVQSNWMFFTTNTLLHNLIPHSANFTELLICM